MLKAQAYNEGSVAAGDGAALSVELAAPWVGVNKTIYINFPVLPAAGDLLTISHQHRNGLPAWKTELFSEDPNLCNIRSFSFLSQVALQAGDSLIVEYANNADVEITCSITLETS